MKKVRNLTVYPVIFSPCYLGPSYSLTDWREHAPHGLHYTSPYRSIPCQQIITPDHFITIR